MTFQRQSEYSRRAELLPSHSVLRRLCYIQLPEHHQEFLSPGRHLFPLGPAGVQAQVRLVDLRRFQGRLDQQKHVWRHLNLCGQWGMEPDSHAREEARTVLQLLSGTLP